MEAHARSFSSATPPSEEERDLRRGPWTVEEDLMLMNYIAVNGDGRWNYLAQSAGLRRTGKSCRLRWLNYLCPDVRRGNITPEEQLLILDLHSRWGNRWSKIAKYLPGRTDNEIKNYWRTRVQKHAKHLRCDVDSKQFQDLIRYLWKPRLVEKIRAAASSGRELGQVDPSTGSWSTAVSSPGSVGLEGCDMLGGDGRDGEGIQATQFVGSADRGLPDSDFASWGENLLWGGDEIWLQ